MSAVPADQLPASWRGVLATDIDATAQRFVASERAAGKRIWPAAPDVFRALALTPFESTRVVLLGQDPYHGPGQAHGLAFSVPPGVKPPPSLRNIRKELTADLGVTHPEDGDLSRWATQGVLLLNATLTVEEGLAGSHAGRGWEAVTDAIVQALDAGPAGLVFLLWGSHAQKKAGFVDRSRHLVLEAPHPSPLSAHRGFLGCRHFSKTNDWLTGHGRDPIAW